MTDPKYIAAATAIYMGRVYPTTEIALTVSRHDPPEGARYYMHTACLAERAI
jgi:hypothetical protein